MATTGRGKSSKKTNGNKSNPGTGGRRRTTAKRETTKSAATPRSRTSKRAASSTRAKRAATAQSGTRTRTTNSRGRANTGSERGGQRSGTGSAQMTTDHDEIQQWVEERGGYPASVMGTETDDEAGVLRIDYPGYSGEGKLQRISWDEFFEKFDDADLVFLYQKETKDGGPSRFSKLVSRREAERGRR